MVKKNIKFTWSFNTRDIIHGTDYRLLTFIGPEGCADWKYKDGSYYKDALDKGLSKLNYIEKDLNLIEGKILWIIRFSEHDDYYPVAHNEIIREAKKIIENNKLNKEIKNVLRDIENSKYLRLNSFQRIFYSIKNIFKK